jgi:hypothetical protein
MAHLDAKGMPAALILRHGAVGPLARFKMSPSYQNSMLKETP